MILFVLKSTFLENEMKKKVESWLFFKGSKLKMRGSVKKLA